MMATGLMLRAVPLLCGAKRRVGRLVPLQCGDKRRAGVKCIAAAMCCVKRKSRRSRSSQRRDSPAFVLASKPGKPNVVISGTKRCGYLGLCTMNKGGAPWCNMRANGN